MSIDETILIKYIDGILTESERAEIEAWQAASPENEKILEQLYFTLQVTSRLRVMKSVDPEIALTRLKARICKQKEKNKFRRRLQILQRVAAVLFFPVLILSAYLFLRQGEETFHIVEVRSNPGVISTFELPDGSKVWLNSGSTLKYPTNFKSNFRRVELRGQGYFEVTKNPDKPFIVQADPVYSVEVLGTSFNVLAYEDEDIIETTLVEGSVILNIAQTDGKIISQKLKPNEKAAYKKTSNNLIIKTVNTDYDTAWRNSEIIFRNHPMDQVLKILSRHYNVKFEVKDPDVLNSIITARFKNEQLPQVMEYIKMASGIRYTITKPEIKNDHTLKMSVIEITK